MRVLLLFVFTSLLRPALAQVAAKEAVGTPICYSSNIPKSVLRLMPRGAKSLFWGTFVPLSSRTHLAVHLYAPKAKELELDFNGSALNGPPFPLVFDVWARAKHLRRVNHVLLSHHIEWPPTKAGIKFYWLNQQKKTQPFFVVKSFSEGEYGAIGNEHLVVFPQGWNKPVVTQRLVFGTWHASNTSGQKNLILQSESGLLSVRCMANPYSDTLDVDTDRVADFSLTLEWRQGKFKPTSKMGTHTRQNVGFDGFGW